MGACQKLSASFTSPCLPRPPFSSVAAWGGGSGLSMGLVTMLHAGPTNHTAWRSHQPVVAGAQHGPQAISRLRGLPRTWGGDNKPTSAQGMLAPAPAPLQGCHHGPTANHHQLRADTGLGAWKRSPAAKPDGDILLPLDGIPQWVGSGLKTNNKLLLARFWYLAYSSVSLCMCILGSRVGGQHNNRGSELQRQGKSQMLGQGAGREFLPPALPPEKPRS